MNFKTSIKKSKKTLQKYLKLYMKIYVYIKQLHSADFKYGSGDLGTNGMALFFATHKCVGLCRKLGLYQFKMCPTQRRRMLRGDLDDLCRTSKQAEVPKADPSLDLKENSKDLSEADPSLDLKESMELLDSMVNTASPDGGGKINNMSAKLALAQVAAAGETHLALANYHKQGRFTHDDCDGGAVIYHLHAAARHGEPHAMWALIHAYSGLPHDLLPKQPSKKDRIGFDMSKAAPPFLSVPEDASVALKLLMSLGNLDKALMDIYGGSISYEAYRVAAMMKLAQMTSDDPSLMMKTGGETSAYEWASRVWEARQSVESSEEAANGLFPMTWHEVAGLLGELCDKDESKKAEAADWFTKAADDATEEGLFGVADSYMKRCG
jgi:hypothetical protein